VFLVAPLLAITVVVLLCSWLPLPWHYRGLLFMFLVVLFLAIAVVVFVLLCSWLHSSWPSLWLSLSSCVLHFVPLSHCRGCAFFVCSWLPFLNHRCGHPLVFMVVFILAIVMVMVIFLCFWLFSSWPLPWSWSSFCVLGCSPPSHCHGHPFMFLVAFLLAIAVVMVILFCSW
jgi:hypothetical protein